jgi:hypothetical protein
MGMDMAEESTQPDTRGPESGTRHPQEVIGCLHVAVPNYRAVMDTPTAMSLMDLMHYFGACQSTPRITTASHTIVATARQTCVNQALADAECTHVLFIDDDMVFNRHHYIALERQALDDDLDFIGTLAFSNSVPCKPCIFGKNPDFEEWGKDPWWHIVTNYPKDQRFEVIASGFGMVLITKRMLKAMNTVHPNAHPHFDYPPDMLDLRHFVHADVRNEDVAFCLNARKAGFKLFVDSRIDIGHLSKEKPVIDRLTYEGEGTAIETYQGCRRCEFVDSSNGNLDIRWLADRETSPESEDHGDFRVVHVGQGEQW